MSAQIPSRSIRTCILTDHVARLPLRNARFQFRVKAGCKFCQIRLAISLNDNKTISDIIMPRAGLQTVCRSTNPSILDRERKYWQEPLDARCSLAPKTVLTLIDVLFVNVWTILDTDPAVLAAAKIRMSLVLACADIVEKTKLMEPAEADALSCTNPSDQRAAPQL